MTSDQNRRKFLGTAAATAAFTIAPRHVLGGPGVVAPSDKIALAYIGVGTQGLREMLPLLSVEDIQIVAVCDPNKEAVEYRDWSKDGLQNQIRRDARQTGLEGGPGRRHSGRARRGERHRGIRITPLNARRTSSRVARPMPTTASCSTRKRT